MRQHRLYDRCVILQNDARLSQLKSLFEEKKALLDKSTITRINGIIENKEAKTYKKVIDHLKSRFNPDQKISFRN